MKSKKIGNERRRNRNRKQNGEQVTSNRIGGSEIFFFSATVAPAPIPQTFVNVACRLARLPALWLMKRHRIDES